MDDLNDLALFAKVVEHRGFSAASRKLGIPKSRLSRRISGLEAALGVRLLQRSSRSLTVTSVGQLFYERCRAVVDLGQSAREAVQEAAAEAHGMVRVSCPMSLAQFWLTPLLPQFMSSHPRVRLMLEVTNRRVDPLAEALDVVIRVRRPPFQDSDLVVRPLGRTQDVLLASPALVQRLGQPTHPSQLSGWPTLSVASDDGRHSWQFVVGDTSFDVSHEPRLATSDMYALRRAALDGMGAAVLPTSICNEQLRDGRLQPLLPDWSTPVGEIQAVFPSRRGMLPAVRALIDYLVMHSPERPLAGEDG